MDIASFMDTDTFKWIVLPLLIFLARIMDQSIGTVRFMFLARGDKIISPLLGFFEVLIWVLAIRQIIQNLHNWVGYIAYAGGFATGNWIGLMLEEKMAVGKLIVRIITRRDAHPLITALRHRGFGVTNVPAEGIKGRVSVIFTIIARSDLDQVIQMIKQFNPKAFYSVETIRIVGEGVFPLRKGKLKDVFKRPPRLYHWMRTYQRYWQKNKKK